MPTVTSKDGTQVGYDVAGTGPAIILVDGAFCFRGFGPMPALAPLLEPHFTVIKYDRRGRGESSDTAPFAIEREIEDIDALITVAGGSAYVYGVSSGAALALHAAASGLNITKLALYEPPFNNDNLAGAADYTQRLTQALAAGQRGDAVAAFMNYVGNPPEAIEGMRHSPMWGGFEAVAPTLAYDNAALGGGAVPVALAARVSIPTLVMSGGASFPFMHTTAQALQHALPNAEYRQLESQTHDAAPQAIAPALMEFFTR